LLYGAAQRSKVTSITVQFSEDILASLSAGDLVIRNLSTSSLLDTSAIQLSYGQDHTVTVTFPSLTGGSLPDGNYTLTIQATGVRDATGNALDANGDGTAGDDLKLDFFRYYGDVDGDRDVDFLDLYFLNQTYLKTSTSPDFNAALDHNGDGQVDADDVAVYRDHYLTRLAPPPSGAGGAGSPGESPRGTLLASKKPQASAKLRMKQPGTGTTKTAAPKLLTTPMRPAPSGAGWGEPAPGRSAFAQVAFGLERTTLTSPSAADAFWRRPAPVSPLRAAPPDDVLPADEFERWWLDRWRARP
jgi:hypothetical protein